MDQIKESLFLANCTTAMNLRRTKMASLMISRWVSSETRDTLRKLQLWTERVIRLGIQMEVVEMLPPAIPAIWPSPICPILSLSHPSCSACNFPPMGPVRTTVHMHNTLQLVSLQLECSLLLESVHFIVNSVQYTIHSNYWCINCHILALMLPMVMVQYSEPL